MEICYMTQGAQTNALWQPTGWCGVGGLREVQEEGDNVHLWLIYADAQQKQTHYYKAIIYQLKRNKFKK